ncbi:hypothetical protein GC175_30605 [bacterium]|nr:hypothetical protein [bacterium]
MMGKHRTAGHLLTASLRALMLLVILSAFSIVGGEPAQAQEPTIGFDYSRLQGVSINNPTSLQFGPDGYLYLSEQDGDILVMQVVRNGANNYTTTSVQTITLVKQIPNYNDNGTLNTGINNRQITGIYVTGTANNPVLYVSSSDPRIGAGGGGGDLNLDTNSGIISKLTWVGSSRTDSSGSWQKVDLVRGLPRSEENHSPNGMALDAAANVLYLAQGGNTNAGAPSNNFAFLTEYVYAAAILSIDLAAIEALPTQTDSQGQAYKYDLPTLDDPTRPGNPDPGDPFGGNDGLNQAKLDPNGPVQIYAPGFRNPYDVIITESGKMYSVDNGANGGWGGHPAGEADYPTDSNGGIPGTCTNEYLPGEPGSTGPGPGGDAKVNNQDGLHYITGPGYYAGHPTPIRGNPAGAGIYTHNGTIGVWRTSISDPTHPLPSDWPPVPVELANPIECDFRNPGSASGALHTWPASTNGLTEYTAANFGGAMQGNLLAASWNGQIYRIQLNATGDAVTAVTTFASNFNGAPLDLVAQGPNGPFPGTIWATVYSGTDGVAVFEPTDYDGVTGAQCTGTYDLNLDEDGDGYSNADEIDSGSNPCSGASQPPDNDNDGVSDLNDPDDDNDTLPDTLDPFPIDAANGANTNLPINYNFFNNDPGTGFYGLGFTGLMSNGTDDYLDLWDDNTIIAGGTAGLFTVDGVTSGDAQHNNQQINAMQFGVNVAGSTGPFTVHARINAPFFNGQTPSDAQSQGLQIGTGDQDNYVKVVLSAHGGNGGLAVLQEQNGSVVGGGSHAVSGVLAANSIDLFLSIDPMAGTIQPKYAIDGGVITDLGAPLTLGGNLLQVVQGTYTINGVPSKLAVGTIATSYNNQPPFAAIWDFIRINQDASSTRANIQFTPNQDINASTYTNNSIIVQNPASSSANITSISIDVSHAVLPDIVFDPTGAAGDLAFKDLTINTQSGGNGNVGFIDHTFSMPNDGGYHILTLNFNDFAPGETLQFSIDIDPTSITGTASPGPGESGSVSGVELTGSQITVSFSNGDVHMAELFRTADSQSGSQNVVRSPVMAAPTATVAGVSLTSDSFAKTATVAQAAQTINVSGPVGGQVRLLQLTASLFEQSGGGNDIEPFEANSITAISEQVTSITDPSGATFSVSLAPISDNPAATATYNIFVAVFEDPSDGMTSLTSDVVVLAYDPDSTPVAVALINAGGSSYQDSEGQTWVADQHFSGGSVYSESGGIANTVNDPLYQSERFGNFSYNIPLADGTYQVCLHFAEIYWTNPNQRVFDVSIEGQLVLDNYDIIVAAGAPDTAVVECIEQVSSTGGSLDISFATIVNNAKVSAIAIFGSGGVSVNQPPVVTNPGAQSNLEGETPALSIAATDFDGPENLSYSAIGLPTGLDIEPTNGAILGTINTGAAAGSPYAVTVTVSDGEDSVNVQFIWTVVAPVTSEPTVCINSGGTGASFFASTGRTFLPDQYFSSGQAWPSSPKTGEAIANTVDDLLYQTERSSGVNLGSFAYEIPVGGGSYTIELHFAEIYWGAAASPKKAGGAGARVFDVTIEGVTVLDNYDINADVGPSTAVIKTFSGINVSDGSLSMNFAASVNQPKLSGFCVIPENTSNPTPTPEITITAPAPDAVIQSDSVTVAWTTTGADPTDHVHVMVDSEPYVGGQPLNGSYTFSGLSKGPHTIMVQVADVVHTLYTNPEATDAVNITVDINTPPSITAIDDITAAEGATINQAVSANDLDAVDTLTLSIVVVDGSSQPVDPAKYSFVDNGDGSAGFSWTTQSGDAGSYTATVTASDGTAQTTESFNIQVNAPAQGAVLKLSPATGNLTPGATFDVDIVVEAGSLQVDGAAAYLNFNPQYLEVVSVTPGTTFNPPLRNEFDNGAGEVNFAAGIFDSFPSGTFTLATVKFRGVGTALGTGISFNTQLPRASAVTFGGENLLISTQPASVNVDGSGSADLVGSVAFEHDAINDPSWQKLLTVKVYAAGDLSLVGEYAPTTNAAGQFIISALPPGLYHIAVKHSHSLQSVIESVALVNGSNNKDLGTLRAGDADNDNFVGLLDFSTLVNTYLLCATDQGFDARADFSEDDCVDFVDFSLLTNHFDVLGDELGAVTRSLVDAQGRDAAGEVAVQLTMQPSATTVAVGETFDIAVLVTAGSQSVDTANLALAFDATLAEVVSVREGGVLDTPLQNRHDNAQGTVVYQAGKLGMPFPSGDFTLVTISLRALQAGNLQFDASAESRLLRAGQDLLSPSDGVVITIGDGASGEESRHGLFLPVIVGASPQATSTTPQSDEVEQTPATPSSTEGDVQIFVPTVEN